MAVDDNSSTTSEEATLDESRDVERSAPPAVTSLRVMIGLAVFLLCAIVGAVIWFIATEPVATKPLSQAIATPTISVPEESQSLGFRGDTRSPSQIIRAARRAQARSEGESPAQ